MNILLLGCSYGVPNYYGKPGDPPETHLQLLLEKVGHTVYNLSQNGSSNFNMINKANSFLDGNEVDGVLGHSDPDPEGYVVARRIKKPEDFSIDLIIWFHTSVLRDHRQGQGTMSEQIQHLSHSTYEKIFRIRIHLSIPIYFLRPLIESHCSQIQQKGFRPKWQIRDSRNGPPDIPADSHHKKVNGCFCTSKGDVVKPT